MSVLVPILIVFVVIAIHEIGHALTAYAFGIKPKSIYIGLPFPPKLEFKTKGGILIGLSPWLIGGGVVLDDGKIGKLSYIKQVAVFIAGPMFNLFAVIATAVLFFDPKIGLILSRELAGSSAESIKLLATGDVSFSEVVGPVGVVDVGSEMVGTSFRMGTMLFWLIINIMLGVINLIPIPGLDGGNIVMYGVVALFGKKERVTTVTKAITLLCTLALVFGMVIVTIKDLMNLFN